MKIQVRRDALTEAMRLMEMVVPRRSPKPVLQCVKLAADKKTVTLLGTNLETAVLYEVSQVMVEEPGEVLVQSSLLHEIARAGRSDVLAIRSTQSGCEIVEEDARYELYGADPKQFPLAPTNDGEPDAVVALDDLRSGIRRTAFAAAKETSRYAIGGVFLKQGNGKAVLVATDGRRLACCQVQEEAQMEAKGIVPPKAMNVLAGIAEDGKEPVRVAVKERQAWFTCGPVRLTTNLLDGTFPDYTRVIPRDCPIKVQMSTVAALGAVRQAMIGVQSDGVQGVKLSLARDRAVFASFGNDRGSAQASVPVEYAGEPFEIGFKPEYVVEGLKAVNAETFELEMTAPDQAAMIRGTGDFVYVFMPMNLS